MRGTTTVLALVGGGFLGALVGAPAGCCTGYYASREPPPTHSNREHPGDYFGAVLDLGERSHSAATNASHAVGGAAVGGVLGSLAGVALALWAGRRPAGAAAADGPTDPGRQGAE
jgi:hypothetical protein